MTRAALRRINHALLQAGRLTLVVAVVAGVVAVGVGAWNYQHPPTSTVTDHENRQSFEATLSARARVTENSSLFETGTVVEDPPVFLRESMPTATLTSRVALPEGRHVRVTHRVTLVYRVTRDGETLWSDRRTVIDDRETTRSGHAESTGEIDVPSVARRLEHVRSEVGSAGSVEVFVRTNVSYRTDAYEGRLRDSAQLTIREKWYDVGTANADRVHSDRVDRTIVVPFDSPLPYAGPAVLGGFVLAVACWAVYLRVRGPSLDTVERRIHRERYAEWISTASLSPGSADDAVAVDSLEGLVDIAIDTGKRVLHDPDVGLYLVIDDASTYCYADSELDDGSAGTSPRTSGGDANDVIGDETDEATDGTTDDATPILTNETLGSLFDESDDGDDERSTGTGDDRTTDRAAGKTEADQATTLPDSWDRPDDVTDTD